MSRAIGMAVLLAVVLALPCANICLAASADGETIALLDVCSPDSPGTTGDITTLAEPAYDVPAILPVTDFPSEKPFIYESKVFSPRDRPPVA
jgi:hypothetical protein